VVTMMILFSIFGVSYSMPPVPHTFSRTINNCYVELREVKGTQFQFMVYDCDHPTIQQIFTCEWHEIPGGIETAVLLVVAQRDEELRKLKDLVNKHYHKRER